MTRGREKRNIIQGGTDGQSKDWEVGENQEYVPMASNSLAGMPGSIREVPIVGLD